jgi:hypothetical protein
MAETSKIRIRMGQLEIEYEGAHDFLVKDLPKLLETVVALGATAVDIPDDPDPLAGTPKKNSKGSITGTVSALAAKLGAKTGPELAIAAAAQLTLVEGQDSFTRDALLTAMKSATNYYKKTFSSNLSQTLKVLQTSGRLTEPATGRLALTASEIDIVEGKLSAG